MNDTLTRLTSALADRYRLDRELGAGGMATEEGARRGNFGVSTPLGSRIYDPLRASPRFAALVRSLGLDVALFTSPNGGRPR